MRRPRPLLVVEFARSSFDFTDTCCCALCSSRPYHHNQSFAGALVPHAISRDLLLMDVVHCWWHSVSSFIHHASLLDMTSRAYQFRKWFTRKVLRYPGGVGYHELPSRLRTTWYTYHKARCGRDATNIWHYFECSGI